MVGIYDQYPHYLYKDTEDGWVFVTKCREETNGKGGHIKNGDSESYLYSSIVQMPAGVTKIPEGIEVLASGRELTATELAGDLQTLVEDGTIRMRGTCAKFDPGRLHCRMWV